MATGYFFFPGWLGVCVGMFRRLLTLGDGVIGGKPMGVVEMPGTAAPRPADEDGRPAARGPDV
jgi:hypothetical protein